MSRNFFIVILLLFIGLGVVFFECWGFWGYCWFNWMAVFIFLLEMIVFYKKNLEYVIEYVVDFDKCCYVICYEVVCYYIDIDYWGIYFFLEVLRDWMEVLMKFMEVGVVDFDGDMILFYWDIIGCQVFISLDIDGGVIKVFYQLDYKIYFIQEIMLQYYEEEWNLSCDILAMFFGLSQIGRAHV